MIDITPEAELFHQFGNFEEVEYLDLMEHILSNGEEKTDRTGVGTKSIFHATMNFDLTNNTIPLLTTKKMAWKSIVSELLWFLEGSDDERRLAEIHYGKPREELTEKKTIWTDNAENQGKSLGYDDGILGPIYGVQWRDWNGNDQVAKLIKDLRDNPQSRRHILSAWNVDDLDKMALPPCHMFAQFSVVKNRYLECALYQRSCDMFLGVPFNIASYSLLTHIIAKHSRLEAGRLHWIGGDCHIYNNHFDVVNEQIRRTPYTFPKLKINPVKYIENYDVDDFELTNYTHYDKLTAPMAI